MKAPLVIVIGLGVAAVASCDMRCEGSSACSDSAGSGGAGNGGRGGALGRGRTSGKGGQTCIDSCYHARDLCEDGELYSCHPISPPLCSEYAFSEDCAYGCNAEGDACAEGGAGGALHEGASGAGGTLRSGGAGGSRAGAGGASGNGGASSGGAGGVSAGGNEAGGARGS